MKNQLEQIENKKKKIVSNLKKLRNKYIACVYDGLIKRKTVREIHIEIRKITTIANNEGLIYTRNMQNYALKIAERTKKELDAVIPTLSGDGSLDMAIALWVYNKFDKSKVFQKTNTISYDVGKKYEADFKDETLKEELRYNRNLIIPRVFYLASSHSDCAIDHLPYQGKIYIDANWRTHIKDEELVKKIQNYIRDNNVKTYQWVIGKPAWFVTRPNCRHYLKAIDTFDVLSKSAETLTRNHKLHSKVGKEITKTIKHPIDKKWYKKENIEDIIKKYEERLEYHEAMWNVKKSQVIKRAIEKDKLLIKKWKEYLKMF